ncbi:MFS transporter [uncultured Bacteroides sp.]|uniref:MFS transporter n=1 Tax=uncultured Bacteroides sp. TaxID=162156 RepID=UPI00374993A8
MEAQNSKPVSYIGPFITLVFLFFVVGFLTTANGQFQAPLRSAFLSGVGDLKNTFVTLITFSWFLAYPLTGKVGSDWVTKFGYKITLIRALFVMIFGLGLFFFSSWYTVQFPFSVVHLFSATVPVGYFIFLLGSFVVGASATILQVVINPYLVACSVKGTQSIQRLSIGGASNSIGTTMAPFFVTGIVFGGLAMEDVRVEQLMMPFLALMAILAVVVGILFKLSLPDIQGTKAEEGELLEKSVWSFRHLTLGVITIFFYVGVEVSIGNNINLYAIELQNTGNAFHFFGFDSLTLFGLNFSIPALMATLYWGGMLIGRLVASSLSKVPPRVQLTVTVIMATLFSTLAILTNNPWLLVAVGLFHSIMWGAIFTLSVTGLGKYTSVASGVFMIGVVGGAIIPLLQGVLADAIHGWRWTWCIVLFGELFILYYAQIGSRVKKMVE